MKFTSNNLPDAVRRKLPQGDPLGYAPAVKHEMRQASAASDVEAERKIQKLICQYLNQHDIFYFWQPMSRRSQLKPGSPDFAFVYKSIPVAAEAKTETGEMSPDQLKAYDQMVANGWHYFIVRSVIDVQQILRQIDSGEIK